MAKRRHISGLLAVALGLLAAPVSAEELWAAYGGSTSLLLQSPDLVAAGITVVETDETAAAYLRRDLALGYEVDSGATLLFAVDSQGVTEFLSGELRHTGGLALSDNGALRNVSCFLVLPSVGRNGFELRVLDGVDGMPVFDVASVGAAFDRAAGLLTVEGELLLNRDTIDAAGNTIQGTGIVVGRFAQTLQVRAAFGRITEGGIDSRFVDTPLIPDFAVVASDGESGEGADAVSLPGSAGWFGPVLFDLLHPMEPPVLQPQPFPQPTDPRYPYAAFEAYRRQAIMHNLPEEPAPEP